MKKLRILGTFAALSLAFSIGINNNTINAEAHAAKTSDRNTVNSRNVGKAGNSRNTGKTSNTRNTRNAKVTKNARNAKDIKNARDIITEGNSCQIRINGNANNKKHDETSNPKIAALKLYLTKRTDSTASFRVGNKNNTYTYEIYRSNRSDGEYTLVGTTQNRTFVDTSVSADASYYYKARVQGFDYDDINNSSNIVFVDKNLKRPTNLQGVSTDHSVTLNWTKITDALKYQIYRSTSKDGDYSKVGTVKDNSFVDDSLEDDSTYYYKVRAIGKTNDAMYVSPFSNRFAITTLKSTDNTTDNGSDNANPNENSQYNKKYAARVLALINAERVKEGLPELTTTTTLTEAANLRAAEIRILFSHTRPDGSNSFTVLDQYNIGYLAAGENIAYGQTSPEAVVEAWMSSPGHRANIMSSRFGKVGIGSYVLDGTIYWTQIFTD